MHTALSPSLIRKNIVRCLIAGLVPMVTSTPGMGKSDIARSVAAEFNLKVIDIRLSQCEPTDMTGLPFFYTAADGTQRVCYIPFDMFPLEGDSLLAGYNGWLIFFDEANSGSRATQAAMYKIYLDRMVGQRKLHPKVAMMAAGNGALDRAIVNEMGTATQSRLIHLEMELSVQDWIKWAITNNIDDRITAFIEFRPELLNNFQPDHSDKTFACPRTWEFTSKLIKGETVTYDDLPLLAGTIGPGPSVELISFLVVYDNLPKMADLMMNPLTTPVPDEMGTRYAMVAFLTNNLTVANMAPFLIYLERFPVEQQVLALRLIQARHPTIFSMPGFSPMFRALGKFM